MSQDPIFTDLLSADLGSVKAPPVLPQGQYYGTIKDYIFGKSKDKQNPFIKITMNNIQAGPAISAEALGDMDLSKETLDRDYFLLDKNGQPNLYYIKELLTSLGLSAGPGADLNTLLPKAAGSPVLIDIGHRNSPDGKRIFVDVKDIKGRT